MFELRLTIAYPPEQSPPADWNPGGAGTASNNAAATSAAIHAAAQHAPPEGYYPYFYPPPGGYVPLPHDGQPMHPDGTNGGGPPGMPQYYPLHPAAYPPFPPYGHPPPGTYPPGIMPGQMQMQQHQPPPGHGQVAPDASAPIDPAKTTGNGAGSSNDEGAAGGQEDGGDGTGTPPSKSKKRSRANREDGDYSPKTKKVRVPRTAAGANGGVKKAGRKGVQDGDAGDVGGEMGQPGIGHGDALAGVPNAQAVPM